MPERRQRGRAHDQSAVDGRPVVGPAVEDGDGDGRPEEELGRQPRVPILVVFLGGGCDFICVGLWLVAVSTRSKLNVILKMRALEGEELLLEEQVARREHPCVKCVHVERYRYRY